MDWIAGRRRLEAGARQQALRDRPDDEPAAPDRHGRGRQAAVRHVDQPRRQPGTDRQPRRQLDQRARDRGQGRSSWSTRCVIGEHVAHVAFTPDGKRALAGKFPGHKVALLDGRWPEGHLHQARPRGRPVAVQPRHHARRQARADRRQRQRRRLRRQRRHRVRDRSRGQARARDRQGGRRRRARGLRDQPDRQARGGRAAARLQQREDRLVLQPQRQRRRAEDRRQEGHARSARSRCAACPRARCSVRTGAGSTSATSSTNDISVLRVDGDTVTNTGTLLKLPGKPASMRGRTM